MVKILFELKSYIGRSYNSTGIYYAKPHIDNFKLKFLQCTRSVGNWHKKCAEIVETEQGLVRGVEEKDYKGAHFYSFQGIPYGKPPISGLRFKLPRGDNKSLKPVMCWVYGGCFISGCSRRSVYGPEILMTGDVVLVTMNYRLALLGFLSMKDPNLHVPGNAGIKDIVMALNWVQKNIENFGGDAKTVTIFGSSVGAAAVHSLILSPMAKGLFHRAILQSGCLFNPWVLGANNTAVAVASALGYDATDEINILHFLRSVPAYKLAEAQTKIPDGYGGDKIRPFGIVVEKRSSVPTLLSENPLDIITSGNYNKVPIIIGYTSREGLYYEASQLKKYGKLTIDHLETKIPHFLNLPKGSELSLKVANQLKEAYFGSATPTLENIDEYFKLETDFMVLRGVFKAIINHLETLNNPIYFYTLSADTKRNYIKILSQLKRAGACHADEIGYLFHSQLLPNIEENSLEIKIIQRIVKLWTNFARHGDPNGVDEDSLLNVSWKPVEKDNFHCLNIGSDLSCPINSDIERMKVWDNISTQLSNPYL